MAREKKWLAFVAYPGVNLLELDATLGLLHGLTTKGYEALVVAEDTSRPINTDTRLQILAARSYTEVPRPHVLVVCGSSDVNAAIALGNYRLVDYLSKAAATATVVASVGTGSLLLAAAGLLEGKTAATHWAFAKLLELLGTQYSPARWVEDGKFITSAGGSGGMDMALHLLAKLGSRQQAKLIQLFAEYDPEPPLGGIEWGAVDLDALVPILRKHRSEIESALAGSPAILAAVEHLTGDPVTADASRRGPDLRHA